MQHNMTREEQRLHPALALGKLPAGSALAALREEGYALIHDGADLDTCIGTVRRQGTRYKWETWDQPLKITTKRKTKPDATASGFQRSITNAVWCLRNQAKQRGGVE